MILNNRYEEPYNKFPGDGPVPLLSKPIVISKLSKKFWLYSQYLRNEILLNGEEQQELEDAGSNNDNNINIDNNINNNIENNNKKIPYKNNYTDINFRNKSEKENNIINYKNNMSKNLKTSNSNDFCRKNNFNSENNNRNEINELNELVFQLKNEINKQDLIIKSQMNEKMKLQKRIHELEQVLKNFC